MNQSAISTTWIYHERQDALLCGQHALNNLVQSQAFFPESLAEIAQQLDNMELTYMSKNIEGGIHSKDYLNRIAEGSGNVDESGNFSIEVLRSALLTQYGLTLGNIQQEGVRDLEVTEMEGFICNRESHWFAIRKINGRFWDLNSTKEMPVPISHFRLAAEIEGLQAHGYSVFCVVDGKGNLPPPCNSVADRAERGLPDFWWNESDLLGGNNPSSAANTTEPWSNVGSGMRLDGKPTPVANGNDAMLGEELTEDEMLQMALANSLQEKEQPATLASKAAMQKLSAEPEQGEAGAVRVQFRMPDGSRKVRRFLKTDLVDVFYTFVEESCPSNGKHLEIRAGFPPKDISSMMMQSIKDAKMSGESLQCRFV